VTGSPGPYSGPRPGTGSLAPLAPSAPLARPGLLAPSGLLVLSVPLAPPAPLRHLPMAPLTPPWPANGAIGPAAAHDKAAPPEGGAALWCSAGRAYPRTLTPDRPRSVIACQPR
jgi:hypothetical protein